MNISLSIDDEIAERARKAATAMGKSLNQVVRDYFEQLAGNPHRVSELHAFERSALRSPGRLAGWKFNREEANCRATPARYQHGATFGGVQFESPFIETDAAAARAPRRKR